MTKSRDNSRLIQNTAIIIPSGTTAARPAGSNGYFRFNITTGAFEGFAAGAWSNVGSSSASSGGGVSWQPVQNTSFIAIKNNGYLVNTSLNMVTVTLPTNPTFGDVITFTDCAQTFSSNNLILYPNGNKVQGNTSNVYFSTNGQSASLIYSGNSQGWVNYATGSSIGPYIISYMIVAGGGGGGAIQSNYYGGGGGGAGGLISSTFTVMPGTPYVVSVGSGGAGQSTGGSNGTLGTNGSNSSAFSQTAIGGGAGGQTIAGAPGGSGGGGSGSPSGSYPGGSGTNGQGNPGGTGTGGPSSNSSGGGGGAGGPGGSVSSGGNGGNGGVGLSYSISGSSVYYAGGGGGGGSLTTGGPGGTGGGGAGGSAPTGSGFSGSSNTGGGGGGGTGNAPSTGGSGGSGGSGIVIIQYQSAFVRATGGTITQSGGYVIHTFTSSGTFTA